MRSQDDDHISLPLVFENIVTSGDSQWVESDVIEIISLLKIVRRSPLKDKLVKLPLDQIRFLDMCADLEHKFAELYRHFALLHADDIELSFLWNQTAKEEEEHARQFDLASRLKGVGMKCLAFNTNEAMAFILIMAEQAVQLLASSPSPEDALKLAIAFEEDMEKFHMSSIVLFEEPSLKKLFDAMRDNDQGHVNMLQIARKNLLRSVVIST